MVIERTSNPKWYDGFLEELQEHGSISGIPGTEDCLLLIGMFMRSGKTLYDD